MKPTLKTFLIGLAASCFLGLSGLSNLQAQSGGFGSDKIDESSELEDMFGVANDDYGSALDGLVSARVPVEQGQDKTKKRTAGAGRGGVGGLSGGAKRAAGAGGAGLGGLGGGMGAQGPGTRPARGGAQGPGGVGAIGGGLGGLGDDEEDEGDGGGMGMMSRSRAQHVTLVLKMYQVSDLLSQSADGPFSGFVLPGINTENQFPARSSWGGGGSSGMGGGFGGGGAGGGAGGGMGGGGRSYTTTNSSDVTIHQLIGTIEQTIGTATWENRGGVGSISNLGETMIVNQTEEVHQQIDTFLQMLRSYQTKKSTVTLKVVWLSINEEQFQSLDIENDQQVNSKVLAELVKSHGQRGQVTCFDGQTTHLAAGNLKSTIESVIPVVGQIDFNPISPAQFAKNLPIENTKPIPRNVMAQGLDEGEVMYGGISSPNDRSGTSVGYQPVSRWINYGAVLQMTPEVDADQKMLTLQVTSILISGCNENQLVPSKISKDHDIDQHNLRCQQFRSNVRLKASTPTLVGGAAFQSSVGEEQSYLVVEAIVNND